MTPEEAKAELVAMNKQSYMTGAIDALETFNESLTATYGKHDELTEEVQAGISIALACAQITINHYRSQLK